MQNIESCIPYACLSVRGIVLLNVLQCAPHFYFAFRLNTIVRWFFSHSFKFQYVKIKVPLMVELRHTKAYFYIMNNFIISIFKHNSQIPGNYC